MDPKKYTLTWQLHSDYLSNIMREMMASEDFTDVTLVTDETLSLQQPVQLEWIFLDLADCQISTTEWIPNRWYFDADA